MRAEVDFNSRAENGWLISPIQDFEGQPRLGALIETFDDAEGNRCIGKIAEIQEDSILIDPLWNTFSTITKSSATLSTMESLDVIWTNALTVSVFGKSSTYTPTNTEVA